jgi:hypothetical protein
MDLNEYKAAIQANLATYESCRDYLSKEHLGEFVLIFGGKVQGVYPSACEASQTGRQTGERPRAVVRIVPTGQPTVDRSDIRTFPIPLAEPLLKTA